MNWPKNSSDIKKMHICVIVTVPFVLVNHLKNQISATVKKGHHLSLVSSPGLELDEISRLTGATAHPIPIARNISPWADLQSLLALYRFFRQKKFDCVHSITPKAGLLSAIAAFVARVPIRFHTFTGQPWATLSGPVRWIAQFCDWLIIKLNTRCYADSESQKKYLIQYKIGPSKKIRVLGKGSLSGVDFNKFNLEQWAPQKNEIRKELRIPESAKVINFTGRINLEKGIQELISAFEKLLDEKRDLFLLLVGPFEEIRGQIPFTLRQRIEKNNRILIIGNTSSPEKYFTASDLLCLPSYREGFGNVVIEAGAMGLPAVATQVVGLVDAVISEKTGILVPPMNVLSLYHALKTLLDNDSLRVKMGNEAKQHARLFDKKIITTLVLKEYDEILQDDSLFK